MRIAVFFLLLTLMACGKKEVPRAEIQKKAESAIECFNVTILDIAGSSEAKTTLMEDDQKLRMLRNGVYGKIGDQFRYCE